MKAWKEACSSREAILLVPKGRRYLLKPITFTGPCKSDLTMKVIKFDLKYAFTLETLISMPKVRTHQT